MAVACMKPQARKGRSLIAVQSLSLYYIHIHNKGFKLCMTQNEKNDNEQHRNFHVSFFQPREN